MNLRNMWSRKTEHWRFRYLPGLVDLLVAASTFQAWKRLSGISRFVLVDGSLLGHSITHETAWISTGTKKWGDVDIEGGYAARICVHGPDCDTEIYRNVTYMPGIAHLARKGLLELYTSAELEDEQARHPVGRFRGYGLMDHGLFRDIRMRSVDGYAFSTMGPGWLTNSDPKAEQQARLAGSDDALYTSLLKKLGAKNNLDAWHIRTAERHNMFCFLTMDFSLKRLVDANAQKEPFRSLRTRVMTPVDLGRFLGLTPVPPAFFSYHDANWFVRSDLHWPDNTRRRRSAYRKRGES
ncbi:hypothetical protein [Rhizobium sp. CCGE 510]|uniref:hypothetical protein n=1 Tax=Rhizobium sp. CCGE 510 TaxID=1132836 RepID=UPI00027B7E6D|nr:hypothetical protein [Rhizobium sp. CCGE 510]EJT04941.1 hypothetical protein RCCGE510_12436 [Rhizobium sp. CCGE 510]